MTGTRSGHGDCKAVTRQLPTDGLPPGPGRRVVHAGAALGGWGRQSDVDRRVNAMAASTGPALGPRRPGTGRLRPNDLLSADELPDGLVVADQCGRIIVFNRAAERLTGIRAGSGHRHASCPPRCRSPTREGRCWWQQSRPYDGLSIRTRHPERSLYLPDGTELLVTIGYVRDPRGSGPRTGWQYDPGAVRRLDDHAAQRGAASAGSSGPGPIWSPPSRTSCGRR